MIKLDKKIEDKITQELRWRFNLNDDEIQDVLVKTIQYLNTLQETLKINDPQQLESIAEKLIKIS